MTAKDEIIAFEIEADQTLRQLGLWGKPLRSVVTALYILADGLFTGGSRLLPGPSKRQAQAMRLISNLSYLAERLADCPHKAIGKHVDDALSVIDDEAASELTTAVSYGTLSELMPAVHRGQLRVETLERGFKLTYPSDAAQRTEARDVVLSELALPFETAPMRNEAWMFDRLYAAWPNLPGDVLALALVNSRVHYRRILQEAPLLPRGAYNDALGFSREDFEGFRVGLAAMGDFCLGMADAAVRRANVNDMQVRRHQRECREWVAPLLKEDMLFGMAAGLGGVEVSTFSEIARYFTVDAGTSNFRQAGEGFWPPFLRLGQSILFSPHALRSMLSERNLIYALNQLDRDRFDQLVSEHLEPALLDDALAMFSEGTDYHVARNVNWRIGDVAGEVDLLVVHSESETALHLQAKAAIPPQGARMTRRIEDRTLEAVVQIESFEKLSPNQRNEICGRAVGLGMPRLQLISGILSRSCFGTHRAWSRLGQSIPLNPLILKGAMARLRKPPGLPLSSLPEVAVGLLDEIVDTTASRWENEELPIFGKVIENPSLRIDEPRLADMRHRIYVGEAV